MINTILQIIKKFTSNISILIFLAFICIVGLMSWKYANHTNKTKFLQTELKTVSEENKILTAQTDDLLERLQTQNKRNNELTNELLKLSEEKNKGYKKVIQYNGRLKNAAIKKPARVERLINNHFDRVFEDVADTTQERYE